jgi:hypothetical protein
MWIHSWEDVHVEMRNGGVGRYFIRARDDTTISTLALSPILQVREDGDVERGDEDANARMRMRGEDPGMCRCKGGWGAWVRKIKK